MLKMQIASPNFSRRATSQVRNHRATRLQAITAPEISFPDTALVQPREHASKLNGLDINDETNFGTPNREVTSEMQGAKREFPAPSMPPLQVDTGNKKATMALKALNLNQPLALNSIPVHSDSSYNPNGMNSPFPWNDDRMNSFTNNRLSILEELTRESPVIGLRPTSKQRSSFKMRNLQRAVVSDMTNKPNNFYQHKNSHRTPTVAGNLMGAQPVPNSTVVQMPSGQRVSHYKEYIAGLQTVKASQHHSSALNESYATAITTNPTANHNRTMTGVSNANSEMMASTVHSVVTIDEYPKLRGQQPKSPSRFGLSMYKRNLVLGPPRRNQAYTTQ